MRARHVVSCRVSGMLEVCAFMCPRLALARLHDRQIDFTLNAVDTP